MNNNIISNDRIRTVRICFIVYQKNSNTNASDYDSQIEPSIKQKIIEERIRSTVFQEKIVILCIDVVNIDFIVIEIDSK